MGHGLTPIANFTSHTSNSNPRSSKPSMENAHVRLDQIHHHLLAILIGKRLRIGVGFGHKILA
jgi:hypothetical protein